MDGMNELDLSVGVLPLVVQVGFAGSRVLVDVREHPGVDVCRFEGEGEEWLGGRVGGVEGGGGGGLGALKGGLGLGEEHFFCGISAMAIGGDMVFSRACRRKGIVQRVFLPQTRDEFFKAGGSSGTDFSEGQVREGLSLLG